MAVKPAAVIRMPRAAFQLCILQSLHASVVGDGKGRLVDELNRQSMARRTAIRAGQLHSNLHKPERMEEDRRNGNREPCRIRTVPKKGSAAKEGCPRVSDSSELPTNRDRISPGSRNRNASDQSGKQQFSLPGIANNIW